MICRFKKKSFKKVANVPTYSYICETAVLALNENNSGSKLMQMGDYRLDHLVGFDLHGKTVRDYWNWKIGAAFHQKSCMVLVAKF
jgi:D-lactate dehydrogenase